MRLTYPIPSRFLLLLAASLSVGAVPDYFLPGPHAVDYKHVNREILGSLDHQLDVYAPHAAGDFPVFLFLSGVTCMAPGFVYSDLHKHLASWGYVVVTPWSIIHSTMDTYRAEWVDPVLKWVEKNLSPGTRADLHPELRIGLHPGLSLDMEKLYVGSHSSGSHVAVNYQKLGNCSNVQANVFLSPVDGVDPFGVIHEFCIEPGQMLDFKTPTMIQSFGLDHIPGIGGDGSPVPACAPTQLGSHRFYNALPGASLLVNLTQYGHADFMDEYFEEIVSLIHFCKSDPHTDKEAVRQELGGLVVSFLKFVGEGEMCHLWSVLSGQEETGTGVIKEVKWKGDMDTWCGQPGCTREK